MSSRITLLFVVLTLLAIFFLATTKVVRAEDITLTWTNPDRVMSLVDAGVYNNPAGTKIYMEVADVSDPAATTVMLPKMEPGTYNFVAVSYDTDGHTSPVSTSSTKVVATFTAVAGAQVFQAVSIDTGFWMIPMGTLNANTECDVATKVSSAGLMYYRVPVDNVDWLPNTTARPVLVVAECG